MNRTILVIRATTTGRSLILRVVVDNLSRSYPRSRAPTVNHGLGYDIPNAQSWYFVDMTHNRGDRATYTARLLEKQVQFAAAALMYM